MIVLQDMTNLHVVIEQLFQVAIHIKKIKFDGIKNRSLKILRPDDIWI